MGEEIHVHIHRDSGSPPSNPLAAPLSQRVAEARMLDTKTIREYQKANLARARQHTRLQRQLFGGDGMGAGELLLITVVLAVAAVIVWQVFPGFWQPIWKKVKDKLPSNPAALTTPTPHPNAAAGPIRKIETKNVNGNIFPDFITESGSIVVENLPLVGPVPYSYSKDEVFDGWASTMGSWENAAQLAKASCQASGIDPEGCQQFILEAIKASEGQLTVTYPAWDFVNGVPATASAPDATVTALPPTPTLDPNAGGGQVPTPTPTATAEPTRAAGFTCDQLPQLVQEQGLLVAKAPFEMAALQFTVPGGNGFLIVDCSGNELLTAAVKEFDTLEVSAEEPVSDAKINYLDVWFLAFNAP